MELPKIQIEKVNEENGTNKDEQKITRKVLLDFAKEKFKYSEEEIKEIEQSLGEKQYFTFQELQEIASGENFQIDDENEKNTEIQVFESSNHINNNNTLHSNETSRLSLNDVITRPRKLSKHSSLRKLSEDFKLMTEDLNKENKRNLFEVEEELKEITLKFEKNLKQLKQIEAELKKKKEELHQKNEELEDTKNELKKLRESLNQEKKILEKELKQKDQEIERMSQKMEVEKNLLINQLEDQKKKIEQQTSKYNESILWFEKELLESKEELKSIQKEELSHKNSTLLETVETSNYTTEKAKILLDEISVQKEKIKELEEQLLTRNSTKSQIPEKPFDFTLFKQLDEKEKEDLLMENRRLKNQVREVFQEKNRLMKEVAAKTRRIEDLQSIYEEEKKNENRSKKGFFSFCFYLLGILFQFFYRICFFWVRKCF